MPTAESAADERSEFDAAFRLVSRTAYLLARQLGRRPDESMDIVQEAALRAWRYRGTRTGEFRPWFLAIVYRQARHHVPEWLPIPTSWEPSAADAFTSAVDPALVQALRELPRRQRAAMWLRYADDLTISDVARIVGCSETAAKQLLLRGRNNLRVRLHAKEESP